MTDRTFCHFGPSVALLHLWWLGKSKFWKNKEIPGDIIFLHMYTTNDNDMMHVSWDIACQTKLLVILCHFLSCYPPNNLGIKILKKWQKIAGDTIILHMCTINDNHMMYGSWDMEHNRKFFRHFGPFFVLLFVEISSFYKSVPKIMIICYTAPEIWYMKDVIFVFHFELFFAFLHP